MPLHVCKNLSGFGKADANLLYGSLRTTSELQKEGDIPRLNPVLFNRAKFTRCA